MNINKLFFFSVCAFVLSHSVSKAQSTYQAGLLPSINLNYKLKHDWAINYKTESRQQIEQGIINSEKNRKYNYILTDNSLIVAKKVGLNSKISTGFLIRFREGNTFYRSIQQFALTQKLASFRLAHRVVTDQTFSSANPTEYRLRYRLASEIPLNGQSADLKELYLKVSNEYLNEVEESEYDLEIRLVPMLGYIASKHHKIELGLDYRVNSFISQGARHSLWLSMNWYIEI